MPAVSIPKPTLCRLEYLTPQGWVTSATVNLLHPERYVERLLEHRKFGRVTVLNARLQPTGKVYVPPELPDPAALVPSSTAIPQLPEPAKLCSLCGDEHTAPFDGSCLL